MIAAAAVSGAAWTSVGVAAGFLLIVIVLLVDRGRMKRRLAAVERSEALLGTDLDDARREMESLRDCLGQGRSGGSTREVTPGPGEGGATLV